MTEQKKIGNLKRGHLYFIKTENNSLAIIYLLKGEAVKRRDGRLGLQTKCFKIFKRDEYELVNLDIFSYGILSSDKRNFYWYEDKIVFVRELKIKEIIVLKQDENETAKDDFLYWSIALEPDEMKYLVSEIPVRLPKHQSN